MGNSVEAKGGYVYEDQNGGAVIVAYKGKDKKVAVPSTIDGKPVIGIAIRAFYGIDLTGVTIPDSVTFIGEIAFASNKITALSLGSGVVSIEKQAFQYNMITDLTIPDSVTLIGVGAFEGNKIANLSLGSGIITIEDKAFASNKLTGSLTIPSSVKAIGKSAFFGGNKFTEVIVPDGIGMGNIAFSKDVKLITASGTAPATTDYKTSTAPQIKPAASPPAAIQKEGGWLFTTDGNSIVITGYEGTNTVVSIPSQIQGKPVVEIGDRAFIEKKLTSVTIPGSVATVGKRAFALNDLTSITIEEGVKFIGEEAFEKPTRFNEDVSKIANVSIPSSMRKIGDRAFQRSRIASITISEGVEMIGKEAFMGNQLKSVNIPEGVTEIWDMAFDENFIESVSLPNSLTEIGEGAFRGGKQGNRLSALKLPPKLKTLGKDAFRGNRLTEIDIPAGVKTIGDGAFRENELARVTIPEGVASIGAQAFYRNKLVTVPIPASVTGIDEEAFAGNQLSGDITVPETVKTIGKGAYRDNQLSGVEIRGKTEIGEDAFWCNQISKLIIGSRVTKIDSNAFGGNKPLVSVTIPASVKVFQFDSKTGRLGAFPDSVNVVRI